MFEKRFRQTIREFSMIKKDDVVAVGLSGGKDSTVLMHCLARLREDLPFDLIAITIDEGISNYREATLKIAKAEVARLGIEHKTVSFKGEVGKSLDDILKDDQSRSCSYCGVFRRRLLNSTAKEVGANKLAIGHNLDDLAHTFLMNIYRGESGRIGRYLDPQSKDESFVKRIRPLLRTPEKEIALFALLQEIKIDHRECPYANNALRQSVRAQLNEMEEKYPGTKFKMLSSFLDVESKLRGQYLKKLNPCSICQEPTSANLCKFCQFKSDL
jgi:uncharacterized protein (TIGR00269 family)